MDEKLEMAINTWKIALAARVKLWLDSDPSLNQDVLTEMLHYKRNTTINLSLNKPTDKMGEPFIAKLSGIVPEFSDSIRQYRELVDSQYGPPEKQAEAIDAVEKKDDKVEKLRDAISVLENLLRDELDE